MLAVDCNLLSWSLVDKIIEGNLLFVSSTAPSNAGNWWNCSILWIGEREGGKSYLQWWSCWFPQNLPLRRYTTYMPLYEVMTYKKKKVDIRNVLTRFKNRFWFNGFVFSVLLKVLLIRTTFYSSRDGSYVLNIIQLVS